MESKYKNLEVWKKSMDLCEMVYKLLDFFPKGEIYGLGDQMKRSAVSIASNIAEGDRDEPIRKIFTFFILQDDPLQN